MRENLFVTALPAWNAKKKREKTYERSVLHANGNHYDQIQSTGSCTPFFFFFSAVPSSSFRQRCEMFISYGRIITKIFIIKQTLRHIMQIIFYCYGFGIKLQHRSTKRKSHALIQTRGSNCDQHLFCNHRSHSKKSTQSTSRTSETEGERDSILLLQHRHVILQIISLYLILHACETTTDSISHSNQSECNVLCDSSSCFFFFFLCVFAETFHRDVTLKAFERENEWR